MKSFNTIIISRTLQLCLVFLGLILFSCEKETFDDTIQGPASLTVQLVGIGSETEDIESSKIASTQQAAKAPNIIEVPLNPNLSAYITLEEDKETSVKTKLNSSNKLAAKEVSPITPGVKYGILVYEGDNLIPNGHKVYTAGQESSTAGFALDGGKTYTFIGYSRNTIEIPTVLNPNKLSTATINNENGELLYYRHVQKVNAGNNNLKVTLRHKFTLVTTEIKVGTTYQGLIQQVANGSFTQARQNASIKLSDSTMTYSAATKTAPITFGSVATGGVKSIKSASNLLIAPESSEIRYNLPTIQVNNFTGALNNIALPIRAGKKYNLVITLDVPCFVPSFSMSNRTSPGSGSITQVDTLSISYNRINSNIPLVINLTKVDNNFNIYYNNKPLFEARYQTVSIQRYRRSLLSLISFSGWTQWAEVANTSVWSSYRAHDAEFSNNSATNVRTMRFSSSTSNFWGNGSIPEIYQLTGTPENPVIRVTIAANGTVSLTGKTSNSSTTQSNIVPLTNTLTLGSDNYPNDPIYNASASTFRTDTQGLYLYEYETKTITKAIEFRMNTLPKNANNRDVIRIRQSTKHNFPQALRSITELDGTFSPTLKVACTQ